MATKTTNYGLEKPDGTDFYDVDVQNSNMDIIDKQMKANANAITQLNSEITNETDFCQKIGNIRIAIKSYVFHMSGQNDYYTIANQLDLKALLGLENVYTSRLTVFFANGDYNANASAHPSGFSIENVNGLANQVIAFFKDAIQGDVRINVLYVYSELSME